VNRLSEVVIIPTSSQDCIHRTFQDGNLSRGIVILPPAMTRIIELS
jgi:hypothetical protein